MGAGAHQRAFSITTALGLGQGLVPNHNTHQIPRCHTSKDHHKCPKCQTSAAWSPASKNPKCPWASQRLATLPQKAPSRPKISTWKPRSSKQTKNGKTSATASPSSKTTLARISKLLVPNSPRRFRRPSDRHCSIARTALRGYG